MANFTSEILETKFTLPASQLIKFSKKPYTSKTNFCRTAKIQKISYKKEEEHQQFGMIEKCIILHQIESKL
jgi:hypothetical protein